MSVTKYLNIFTDIYKVLTRPYESLIWIAEYIQI